jgi:hypothetical protein
MADMPGRTVGKAAGPIILLALAMLVLVACGSGGSGDDTTKPQPPPVSAATADHLAKLSNRVASELDAGDTCGAAYAADQLQHAVSSADLPATLRPGVEEVATDLVNEVNCPPPPPPPEPEKKPKKPKNEQQGEQQQGDHQGGDHGPKPPGHGDKVPPGQVKIKGEPG